MPVRASFSFEPMLCQSAERPPDGRDWRYELKLDGFRAIGRESGRRAQLWSRNQKNLRQLSARAAALATFPQFRKPDQIVGLWVSLIKA
jgi:ATP-dependent DNA ligase